MKIHFVKDIALQQLNQNLPLDPMDMSVELPPETFDLPKSSTVKL